MKKLAQKRYNLQKYIYLICLQNYTNTRAQNNFKIYFIKHHAPNNYKVKSIIEKE
jgi:hypothetical protein